MDVQKNNLLGMSFDFDQRKEIDRAQASRTLLLVMALLAVVEVEQQQEHEL